MLGLAFATRGLLTGRSWWPTVWVTAMVVLWAALTSSRRRSRGAPIPVAFAVLRVLPFGWAVATVTAMTAVVTGAWLRISDGVDPAQVAGPIAVALVTVLAYRALDLESQARQVLLDRLVEAQADLAEEQRRTGALAERTRLVPRDPRLRRAGPVEHQPAPPGRRAGGRPSRTPPAPTSARLRRPPATASTRYVAWCATWRPPTWRPTGSGPALPTALREVAEQAAPGIRSRCASTGTRSRVPEVVAAALVPDRARRAGQRGRACGRTPGGDDLKTYQEDEEVLDVRDDGNGFPPRRGPAAKSAVAASRGSATGRRRSAVAPTSSAPGRAPRVSLRSLRPGRHVDVRIVLVDDHPVVRAGLRAR